MDEKRSRTSRYAGGEVVVVSRTPLTGTVKLILAGEEPVHLQLDRQSARKLAGALLDFLGDDVPVKNRTRPGDEGLRPGTERQQRRLRRHQLRRCWSGRVGERNCARQS
jgi:hypothetical protein